MSLPMSASLAPAAEATSLEFDARKAGAHA